MRLFFRPAIILLFFGFVVAPSFAQEYPSNYRDIPCPDTGQQLYQTSPDFFNLPYFQNLGPKHYAARCYYENGNMTGVWSDDFANKEIMCNWPYWKGKMLGDRYNLVETLPSGEKVFGFAFKTNPEKGVVDLVDITKGGPADRAGLKAGHEILDIDGLGVSKFTLDEVVKFLKSRDSMTFNIHDPHQMVYRKIKITKEDTTPDSLRFDLYSPIHFAEVAYSYKIREGHEEEDREFWYAKALEFLKKFENQGVICMDLDVSDQGPLAE